MRHVVSLLLALAILPAWVRAQEEPRYVPFKIDKDYEAMLSKRFEANKQLGPLKDLVKQIMSNPDKLPFDPEKFKDMKLEDENLKKLVQEWVASDPSIQQSLREWLKKNPMAGQQPDMKKLQKDLKVIVDEAVEKGMQPVEQTGPPSTPSPIELPNEGDPFAKIAERALKQTERSRLGEWLKESPAWKRAFEDLRGTASNPDAPRWKLEGWQAKLLDQEGAIWKLGETTMQHLRNVPKPNLDKIGWSAPGINRLPTPDVGPPSLPSTPSLGKTVTWLLVAVLVVLIGWRLVRWRKRSVEAVAARPDLGPWPVRPEAVATRAELIQAFDYLALWTLGLAVKSWNHHAVARSWQEKAPACAAPALALATLYEQARYTAGADVLGDRERDEARRVLAQIAEAL